MSAIGENKIFVKISEYTVSKPGHSKVYDLACLLGGVSDQHAHPLSLISLHCSYEESLGHWLPIGRLVTTLIKLCICTD